MFCEVLRQPLMHALAVAAWNFERPLVSNDVEHLPGAVHENRATVAASQVFINSRTQIWIYIFIKVVGQLLQDSMATHHGFFPLKNGSRSIHRLPNIGVSCSLI